MLRSVTQLTKTSTNDLTGAAAEAFSGNATPSLSQSVPFFSNFRTSSSANVHGTDAPPGYDQEDQLQIRRASEGSVASNVGNPLQETLSSSSSMSSPRQSFQSRRASYFSMTSTPFASASATPSGNTSVSASPGPRPSPYQQPQQPPKSQRRGSGQLGAAARQAFRSSRSFLGLPVGISEDDTEANQSLSHSNGSPEREAVADPTAMPATAQGHTGLQTETKPIGAEQGSKTAASDKLTSIDNRTSIRDGCDINAAHPQQPCAGADDDTVSAATTKATAADILTSSHTLVAATDAVSQSQVAAGEAVIFADSRTAAAPSASEASQSGAEGRPIGKAKRFSNSSKSENPHDEQTNAFSASAAASTHATAEAAAATAVLRHAPAPQPTRAAAQDAAKTDDAVSPRQSYPDPLPLHSSDFGARLTEQQQQARIQPQLDENRVSDEQQQQQQLSLSVGSAHSVCPSTLQTQTRSGFLPSHVAAAAAAAYSTAPSTPLNSDRPSVIVFDDAAAVPSSSSSSSAASITPLPPSLLEPGVSIGAAPTLSSASSTTNITTLTSPSTPNTIGTATTTAATTPSHSTLKLAQPTSSSASSVALTGIAPSSQPSILLHNTSSAPYNAQHTPSLNNKHPTKTAQPVGLSGVALSTSARVTPEAAAAAPTAIADDNETGAHPLTPPSSSEPCRSGASAIRFSTDVASPKPIRTGPPSPPASSARESVSTNASRRGSSTESALSSLSPLSPHSSLTSASGQSDTQTSPELPANPTRGTGRVSFDLRRFSLFSASPSPASNMSSNSTRASFAGVGNGLPPNAADANTSRQASSPSSNSASKFFSRISGGSRRGSAQESPLSSPETKSRSRFASFAKLGRSGDGPSQPKDIRGLRNSMQPWASASTDVLNLSPGQTQVRNSLSLAREEATRPRKSLHLPRPNLIDLDSDEMTSSTATASTSAAAHDFNTRAQPSIAMASIKPEKPASPSLQSARRPSFNFLRRASAASTNSNVDNVNGERRGSFARNLMQKTLSRNSKSDAQPDSAKTVSTSPREADAPVFRNGIFDSQAPSSTAGLAYPGMSSTVNWNAPNQASGSSQAEIAPNDVDPVAVAIPAYPGSVAAKGDPAQPKTVTDLSSGILSERRPSQGIDQEQDAAEATDTVADSLDRSGATSSITGANSSSTDSTASRQRPTRSSHALSHLPRLNSMRAISGAGQADSNAAGRAGADSAANTAGETSDEEQEVSEDEDDADLTGQTSGYHDLDETETDDETDYDNSPVASRRMSAAPMTSTGSSGGLNRNRPTESLVLPPAPTFIPNVSEPVAQQESDIATSSAAGASQPTSSAGFSQTVGRDTWTSFNASGFTPFETPTPSYGGSSYSAGFAGPTPRARQELSESSYFTARPGTSNSNRATTAGTMSGDAPPPSPSIISRSRAPSSASMRTLRTPGAGAISSGPVPNRSMPAPVGTLPPLALNRQISTASGMSTRIGATDRSKSPAQVPGSSRPSTSGTLTPHQVPSGERNVSREPSIDRPASERPASRQAQGDASPKKVVKPLVGLDGVASSAPRPNFYQQKSQSLVDLLGPASRRVDISTPSPTRPVINEPPGAEALRTPTTPRPPSEAPAYSKKDGLAPINTGLTTSASIASPGGMSLGRRRSMFEMRAEPPGYSIIHNRPEGPQIILPREEEGREKLPNYYCGVHIEGYLPRKMEFSAPGVQAKDRSWKRQYFVLHGTSLRVYKNDLSVDRHAVNGVWGEMKGVHVHLEPMNEDGSNGSGSGIGLGAAAREAISHTPLGSRHDTSKNKEATTQFDSKHGLIRNYTLQGAESGLAADYLKRRHVVRVRAEGEQFLLQTRSDRHVVDWIEALQASTNVSMDLEKRAMPKFITLPRRRRRRRRNPDGTTITAEEQEARDLAEAQRRSVAEAGGRATTGAAGGAESTPRGSMSQRPSMSIENELNPSAAFERMLREDQEEGGRQSAAVM